MKTKTSPQRLRRHARSLVDCLGEFLTPALWKQAHSQRHSQRRSPRWGTQPLVLVLLLMTWCCGDSQPEAEGSLLALQLMLAQAVLAQRPVARRAAEPVCSPRKGLLVIRQERYGLLQRGRRATRRSLSALPVHFRCEARATRVGSGSDAGRKTTP